jgi:hypothetical protein
LYNFLPNAYNEISFVRSSGGAHLPHIECIAGKHTP